MFEINQLRAVDPNALPYFIKETRTGRAVAARFELLTPDDESDLRGEVWSAAMFSDVWRSYIHVPRTFKLVPIQKTAASRGIQGIIHVGKVMQPNGFLKRSLLESAPTNQYQASHPQFRGVGRVLVARLVVESYQMEGHGRVLVRPRPGTEPFYESMGFTPAPRMPHRYILNSDGAGRLLQRTLLDLSQDT